MKAREIVISDPQGSGCQWAAPYSARIYGPNAPRLADIPSAVRAALQHITACYDELADVTLFCSVSNPPGPAEIDEHFAACTWFYAAEVREENPYSSEGALSPFVESAAAEEIGSAINPSFAGWFRDIIGFVPDFLSEMQWTQNSTFALARDCIRQRSQEFYRQLLQATCDRNRVEPYYLQRCWKYLCAADYFLFVQEQLAVLEQRQLGLDPLTYVFENNLVKPDGLWLEFGVGSGGTTNRIAAYARNKVIYGFDSFQGLPEHWRDDFPQGSFSTGGTAPDVSSNVALVRGMFGDSLPMFCSWAGSRKVTFLHVDCDLYSSAKTVFSHLGGRLESGCVIVFDELVNYPGFENHELRAFYDFVKEQGITFEWIGMNGPVQRYQIVDRYQGGTDQRAAVRVL